MQSGKTLKRSFAHHLLNIANSMTLEQWLGELDLHLTVPEQSGEMVKSLEKIIVEQYEDNLPEPLTFSESSTRAFEENWWNDIKFLAQGEFVYKDNADIMLDETTLSMVQKQHRDLESFSVIIFIGRYKKIIADTGMSRKAIDRRTGI